MTSSDTGEAYISTNYAGWGLEGTGTLISTAGTAVRITKKSGLDPNLVFRFIKKNKMSVLGQMRYKSRINKLEQLALKYLEDGQEALADKFLGKIAAEVKLAEITGAGVKLCIKKDVIYKKKYKIRGGHISDTLFEDYTNVIPDHILNKKKKIDACNVFDGYVIYHYYNEELEAKKETDEPISAKEKADMKDPILFGKCKEHPSLLFFIADWEDDYCDLTFSDLVDTLDIEDEELEIPKKPTLNN